MAATDLQPAFVLHRRRYGDSSLLLELFTQRQGRCAVVAKGLAEGRRGRAGLLQPFAPLLVGCRGSGEVLTLTGAEPARAPFGLRGRQLYCGFYVNELVLRLTARHDPLPQLFAHYLGALADLAAAAAPDATLRRFELHLLDELGFGLRLDVEADGVTAIADTGRYDYLLDGGPVPGSAYSGAMLLCLARGEELGGTHRVEARDLLRAVLNHHLGGRPLRSRELFHGALSPSEDHVRETAGR